MKTYCFCVMLIGKGDNKGEAWLDALESERLEEYEICDIEVEWIDDEDGNEITEEE